MSILLIIFALLMGGLVSIYLPMITQTAKILNSAPLANVPFFGVALLSSIGIAVLTGSRERDFSGISSLPIWLLSAGVMSAIMVLGSSYLIPRIGLNAFFVLLVSGQVIAGMVFSQFGFFGTPISTVSVAKFVGAVMVILGAGLVTYK
ncbi:hypothetical protein OA92_22960 [Marinomonas sp. SBI22]|uniref:DMT family transporter n=1 Tax=unclassified Marinomonas TaxID=196814 RepID=UPI0007AF3BA8|nr:MULTISPECIES: DMT family transporter [unclassified Marinomonas]KZM38654.1 hypothetical protein OA92_22960 [Marinomonas sp. SBI22]KZM39198.1 hypothetical protein OA91_22810 [Marinomonas sp. SBI8L]